MIYRARASRCVVSFEERLGGRVEAIGAWLIELDIESFDARYAHESGVHRTARRLPIIAP